ncbi:MAG: universal stress protein [Burkholderiaceae bacterium]|nr:universal stress protein [Burkholderiaceae bacterium]
MKILLPYDGSAHARRAVRFVAARTPLAGREPTLWLLNVQPPRLLEIPTAAGRKRLGALYARRAESVLRPARTVLKRAGLDVRATHLVGVPGLRIARVARDKKVDLIVIGSHGRTAAAGLLMGSVASTVLAHCDNPVLLLRDGEVPKGASLRVGVAVDGSAYGEAAVRWALSHRDLFGPQPAFELLHAVRELPLQTKTLLANLADTTFTQDRVRELRRQEYARAVRSTLPLFAAAGVPVRQVELTGEAGEQLAAHARRNLDVLVMGSHGQGLFKAAVLGSVATRVAARCATPLALIRAA